MKKINKYALSILILTVLPTTACQSDSKEKNENAQKEIISQTKNLNLPSVKDFNTHIAFVPSIGEGTISAINLDNNTVSWTLKVSNGAGERKAESAMGIAATRNGKIVFTGDVATKEVVIVDAENQKIIKRIPLKHGIHAIDIDPNDRWVWVSGDLEEYPWLSATSVIDVEKQQIVTVLSPALGRAAHFGFTPDGNEVWVASVSTNTVWVWDANERKILDVIPLVTENLDASSPEAGYGLIGVNEVTISPDGKTAYAVGPEAGTVFAIDVKERKLKKTRKVGERTHGISVSRDGKEVWTANNNGTVTILDANTLDILATIDLSQYADELPFAHIAFALDGRTAYVSIAKDVAVIDCNKREVKTVIPFGYGTHEISLEDFYVQYDENAGMPSNNMAQTNDKQNDTKSLTRESDKAGIRISVTPKINGDILELKMSLNTHSGDIMKYDLTKLSVLHFSDGSVADKGFTWMPGNESSHHRQGILKIRVPNKDLGSFEFEVKEIGVKSRKFVWDNL